MLIKNKNKTTQKKILLVASIFVLVVSISSVIITIFYPHKTPSSHIPEVNYEPASQEEQTDAANTKQQSVDKDTSSSKEDLSNEDNNAPGSAGFSTVISAVNQTDNVLQIRAFANTVSTSGTCTLTLAKDSSLITKTSGLSSSASISSCQGFDVAISELSTGTWNISINITINGDSSSASQTVVIT